jgi:hypothetical protein
VTRIRTVIAAASLIAQGVFFFGSVFLLADLFSLVNIITPKMEEDPSLLVPYIRETLVSYEPLIGIGVVGAIVTYAIYFNKACRARWFVKGTRVLGWLWLPFIPIGTVIGIVLLGASGDTSGTKFEAS